MCESETCKVCAHRREFRYLRAEHGDLLPSGLPRAYVARKKCEVLSEPRCCSGSRFSSVLALPPVILSWNSRLGRHAKYGFASLAADQRDGFRRCARGSLGRAPLNGLATY